MDYCPMLSFWQRIWQRSNYCDASRLGKINSLIASNQPVPLGSWQNLRKSKGPALLVPVTTLSMLRLITIRGRVDEDEGVTARPQFEKVRFAHRRKPTHELGFASTIDARGRNGVVNVGGHASQRETEASTHARTRGEARSDYAG